jgi:ribonuclease Y
MENLFTVVLVILFTLIGAGVAGYVAYGRGRRLGVQTERDRQDALRQSAEDQAARIVAEAEAQARQMQLAIKEEEVQRRKEMDAEAARRRAEVEKTEERLQNRLDSAERRLQQIDNRERNLNKRETKIGEREAKLTTAEDEWSAELQRVAAMNQDEARQVLLERVEQTARQEMARKIREVEAEANEEAERRARSIITLAIERLASDHVNEFAVSTVDLPSDEMKGRIIGRQGRNIRAIEQALGVDLVVDDTPEAIIISSYDPIRREVARMALSKLVADGRIHPARIEKEVEKAQQEIDRIVAEAGEQAMIEAGVSGLHREVQKRAWGG